MWHVSREQAFKIFLVLSAGYCKYLHHPENEVLALHCPEGFDLTKAREYQEQSEGCSRSRISQRRVFGTTNAASVEQPTPRLWNNQRRVCGTTNAASVEQPSTRLWDNQRRVCGTTNAASVGQPTPRLWSNHRRVCGTTNAASVGQQTPRLWDNKRRVCGTTNAPLFTSTAFRRG